VAPTTVAKKAPSFLFVIQAKQGKIETKNGKTYLVLQHADVNHVIMFSDRPNRIVKTITGNDLQKLWKVGNDSFEKDPPNAVLSSAGQKAQIVILKGINVSKTTVEFPISISAGAHMVIGKLLVGSFFDVTITIDVADGTPGSWDCGAEYVVKQYVSGWGCVPYSKKEWEYHHGKGSQPQPD